MFNKSKTPAALPPIPMHVAAPLFEDGGWTNYVIDKPKEQFSGISKRIDDLDIAASQALERSLHELKVPYKIIHLGVAQRALDLPTIPSVTAVAQAEKRLGLNSYAAVVVKSGKDADIIRQAAHDYGQSQDWQKFMAGPDIMHFYVPVHKVPNGAEGVQTLKHALETLSATVIDTRDRVFKTEGVLPPNIIGISRDDFNRIFPQPEPDGAGARAAATVRRWLHLKPDQK